MSGARSELAALVRGLAGEIERRIDGGQLRTPRPVARVAPGAPGTPTTATRPPVEAGPSRPAPAVTMQGRGTEISPGSAETAAGARSRSTAGAEDPGVAATRARAASAGDLAELKETVAACEACGLCKTRTQTVFADGPSGGTRPARVLFVGEAPGQHEDEQGVPFVGRAGQLLTDIIHKGMGLRRPDDVYIANVLKCRPPGNRDPEPGEKALCTPFLDRQIELIAPEVIIPLGKHAAQHLLASNDAMGRLRGRVHERDGRRIVPTFHPAYLLRDPSRKKDCWQDIQLAMGLLGLERPGG